MTAQNFSISPPRLSGRGRALAPFMAIVRRDLHVLKSSFASFAVRTLLQPVLMLFTFAYVLPRLQLSPVGDAASASDYAQIVVPGIIGAVILVQSMQVLALPLFMEMEGGDLEDRLGAPLTIGAFAAAKMLAGGLQIILAAALVIPLAYLIPLGTVDISPRWGLLLPLLLLCAVVGAAAGTAIGAQMTMEAAAPFFSVITMPVTFLGAMYYPWSSLDAIPWLQVFILINPLVYINEGLRATMTDGPHLPLLAVGAALLGWAAVFVLATMRGMRRRFIA